MYSYAGRVLALDALLAGRSRKAGFPNRAQSDGLDWRCLSSPEAPSSQCPSFEHRLVSADWHWCNCGRTGGAGMYPSHLPSLPPVLPRWALWWPSAGSAPGKLSTGASSATSSWPGSWLSQWLACSAPGWWRCWCMVSCLTSEELRKGEVAKLVPRGEAFPWKDRSERFHLPYLTSYLLYITMCHIGDMVMWCHFLYIKEIYMHIVGNNT